VEREHLGQHPKLVVRGASHIEPKALAGGKPVLDGGAIFLLLVEGALAIVGMTISLRVRERIQQVGFVVVILLMVFVITNDIVKQVGISRGNSGGNAPAASPAPGSPTK